MTPLGHHCVTAGTPLGHPWDTPETPLGHPWDSSGTPLCHPAGSWAVPRPCHCHPSCPWQGLPCLGTGDRRLMGHRATLQGHLGPGGSQEHPRDLREPTEIGGNPQRPQAPKGNPEMPWRSGSIPKASPRTWMEAGAQRNTRNTTGEPREPGGDGDHGDTPGGPQSTWGHREGPQRAWRRWGTHRHPGGLHGGTLRGRGSPGEAAGAGRAPGHRQGMDGAGGAAFPRGALTDLGFFLGARLS